MRNRQLSFDSTFAFLLLSLATTGFDAAHAQRLSPTDLARSDVGVSRSFTSARKPSARNETAKVQAQYQSHPLWPALEMAVDSYKGLRRNVRDYSCSLVRQERVQGLLRPAELMEAKVRHERTINGEVAVPFGLYLKVLGPSSVKGREVLYVDGKNDDMMLVRNGGRRFAFLTVKMKPDSERALRDNRYPVSEFGLENLVKRLIEVVKEDIRLNVETKVEFLQNASIDGRGCTGIRVTHPTFSRDLRFHSATVFIDDVLKVPVHYEAYGWPADDEETNPLLEKYTYRDIKLNVGYADLDFDASNPNYRVK